MGLEGLEYILNKREVVPTVSSLALVERPEQVEDNSRAGDLPAIDHSAMEALRVIYDTYIRGLVHHRW